MSVSKGVSTAADDRHVMPEPEPVVVAGPVRSAAAVTAGERAEPRPPGKGRWVRFGVSVALAGVFSVGLVDYRQSLAPSTVISGVKVAGQDVGGLDAGELRRRLQAQASRYLDEKVVIKAGDAQAQATRRDLGAAIDVGPLADTLLRLGRTGAPFSDLRTRRRAKRGELSYGLTVTVDGTRASDLVLGLKEKVDRLPHDARLDLEKRTVVPHERGVQLKLVDSLVAIERGLLAKAREIPLVIAYTEPKVTAKHLANVDVSHVIGSYETRYGAGYDQSDRTYNLKVAAEKLNGRIIMPGEVFSFNQAVGERSEKEGFRTAPVIQAGEMVDGVGGGTCQISSTLHGAAFFAGLEMPRYTPHSRPSAYILAGLDATVVWPKVDLELKNPFDFPVAIHASVRLGRVRVELLGPKRPYTVAFEREVMEEKPYETILRDDETLPMGVRVVDQPGVKGYKIKRHRYLMKDGKVVKHQTRILTYPPTKELVRIGKMPIPEGSPPPEPPKSKPHRPYKMAKKTRIVR